jgi:hypothetical protein
MLLMDDSDGEENPEILHMARCTAHSIPYTLYPITFILYSITYSLHPTPYTLYYEPSTKNLTKNLNLYPIPYTLYPTPYTLYYEPSIKHSTLYHIPYTLHPVLRTVNQTLYAMGKQGQNTVSHATTIYGLGFGLHFPQVHPSAVTSTICDLRPLYLVDCRHIFGPSAHNNAAGEPHTSRISTGV